MSDLWQLAPRGRLTGELIVPGDKSISHRALMFNALSSGTATVSGVLNSEDVGATREALEQMGATIVPLGHPGRFTVSGPLRAPSSPIDCGNSGTSFRLLAGIAAGSSWSTVLDGDHSLRKRPMMRIVTPLRKMGAAIEGPENGRLPPLTITGGALEPVSYDSPLSSAQVKSCLLLAGLKTGVRFREPRKSRDHTERMLTAMGATLTSSADGWIELKPCATLAPLDVIVPSDMSAAAFWLVAASIVPGSNLLLPAVCMNPTRAGVVDALLAMGADITLSNERTQGCEPVADILVRAATLKGTAIGGELALRCLDELPVIAVAASFAQGTTTISGAEELRVKESDRIVRVVAGLNAIGATVHEQQDGMVIEGSNGAPTNGHAPGEQPIVDASGDHRIAMAFAVAALGGAGPVQISGAESVRSSYPDFLKHMEQVCQN